jgi:hypothetical protein
VRNRHAPPVENNILAAANDRPVLSENRTTAAGGALGVSSKMRSAALQEPPFSKDLAIRSPSESFHPASFRHDHRLTRPQRDPHKYLEVDLKPPKLNAVYRYRWLAGILRPARPVHRQRLCVVLYTWRTCCSAQGGLLLYDGMDVLGCGGRSTRLIFQRNSIVPN